MKKKYGNRFLEKIIFRSYNQRFAWKNVFFDVKHGKHSSPGNFIFTCNFSGPIFWYPYWLYLGNFHFWRYLFLFENFFKNIKFSTFNLKKKYGNRFSEKIIFRSYNQRFAWKNVLGRKLTSEKIDHFHDNRT